MDVHYMFYKAATQISALAQPENSIFGLAEPQELVGRTASEIDGPTPGEGSSSPKSKGTREEIMAAELYDPKKALYKAFPEMAKLSQEKDDFMNGAEQILADHEEQGRDTSCARAVQLEARWRIGCTSDYRAALCAVDRLKKEMDELDDGKEPTASVQDAEGSFAPCTNVWFLKLDRSTDQLLARNWPWRLPPAFLDQVDDPIRMVAYLQDLCWSDVQRCGCDNRKELNLAISVIARLVMRGGQAGYLAKPGFVPVFERFVQDWQDPKTGFFEMTYILENGEQIRTQDLSLTFHMVRYVPHLIRDWPRLIETLLAMKDQRYPQGWLENGKMTDHNNYDVVELFARGWSRMTADQRRAASVEVSKMLDWCLADSVAPDGSVRNPDKGDMVMDSYYFAAAFLDTIGFFDRGKRFWTDTDYRFDDAEQIRMAMIGQMSRFNQKLTVVEDTLSRLTGGERPHSNALL
jgi:hypothetical protein